MSKNKEMFSNLLNFGINLNLNSEKENLYYAQCFAAWMMQQEDVDATMLNDEDIEIYSHAELTMIVTIKDSTLTLKPITESCFDAVLMILRFVSEMHDDTKKEFKKLNTVKMDLVEEAHDDEDSEDDLEWI